MRWRSNGNQRCALLHLSECRSAYLVSLPAKHIGVLTIRLRKAAARHDCFGLVSGFGSCRGQGQFQFAWVVLSGATGRLSGICFFHQAFWVVAIRNGCRFQVCFRLVSWLDSSSQPVQQAGRFWSCSGAFRGTAASRSEAKQGQILMVLTQLRRYVTCSCQGPTTASSKGAYFLRHRHQHRIVAAPLLYERYMPLSHCVPLSKPACVHYRPLPPR